MRTITTTYGHLDHSVTYTIGVSRRVFADRPSLFYGKATFTNGSVFITTMKPDEQGTKDYVNEVIAYSKEHDFPMKNGFREQQWFSTDEDAPSR